MQSLKVSLTRCVFNAVLKTPTVALALILFVSAFHAFAADTANDRAPHEYLDVCVILIAASLQSAYFLGVVRTV